MGDAPATPPAVSGQAPPPDGRLDSWKEVAAYLRRDVKTAQRWEKREGMPVHRHQHDKSGSVYAFRSELDAWAASRRPAQPEPEAHGQAPTVIPDEGAEPLSIRGPAGRRHSARWLTAVAALAAATALLWYRPPGSPPAAAGLEDARFSELTDFGGTEQAGAISRDGRFVAFLSDRDGRTDVWVTQLGTGRFYNLTRGEAGELVNPSIRALGFSPDGADVTYWVRRTDDAGVPRIDVWAAPVLGGPPRIYLENAAEFDWSPDGLRLAYHTPGPGDPLFVSGTGRQAEARRIFAAPAGLHGHFVLWSPDQEFIYFVQGQLPDRLDLWRIRPGGGSPERMTHHEAVVSHPVVLDATTLAYLAGDRDGSGPWLQTLDVPHGGVARHQIGLERYTSLSASADGRRVVATRASARGTLWRLPLGPAPAALTSARKVVLTTRRGSAPRLGASYLLYVSSNGTSDGIWKLQGDAPTELWKGDAARIEGAPAISRDGGRFAFTVRQGGRTSVIVANSDGTGAREVAPGLQLQGPPAWRPDGTSLAITAIADGMPQVWAVPLDGSPAAPLVREHSSDPVWSPDGRLLVYSGPDIGTTFEVRAVRPGGVGPAIAPLTLSRGSRHITFTPDGRSLVVLRGEIRHKNLWLIDLTSGAERQLTDVPAGFEIRDFDLSADGREVVLEQFEERSDIVLLELPPK